jgi:hypothetical protein
MFNPNLGSRPDGALWPPPIKCHGKTKILVLRLGTEEVS